MKSYLATLCICLLLAPAGVAQSPKQQGPAGLSRFTTFIRNTYTTTSVPPVDLSNSARLDQLIRQGNLYLSLRDAIALALENNIDIAVQRYQFQMADYSLRYALSRSCGGAGGGGLTTGSVSTSTNSLNGTSTVNGNGSVSTAGGSCDPSFSTNWNWSRTARINTNTVVSGGNIVTISPSTAKNFSFNQAFGSGAQISVSLSHQRFTTNNANTLFVPGYNDQISFRISQPLLRGFGFAYNRRNVVIAKNDIKRTDLDFVTRVNTTLNTVIQSYWNLVAANSNLVVARQSLELAQKLYENNQKEEEEGVLARIDVLNAQSQMEIQRAALIRIQTTALTQENNLKNLLSKNGIANPLVDEAHIVPTDRIRVPDVEEIIPIQDLISMALQKRPEPASQRLSMADTQLALSGLRKQVLPSLNLTAQVSNPAAGGLVNTAPYIDPITNQPTTRVAPAQYLVGGVGNLFTQMFTRPTLNYSVGFSFNVTLRNRAMRNQMAEQELSLRQNELGLRRTINQIRVDVKNAQIAIAQARTRYASTQNAVALQEQVLQAEELKLQLGASTVYQVVLYQRDLATARYNFVSAQVAYALAKLQMDAATGNLMDRYSVEFNEAKEGEIGRRADPIPDVSSPPQDQTSLQDVPRPLITMPEPKSASAEVLRRPVLLTPQ